MYRFTLSWPSTSWRRVISFKLRTLYSQGKCPRTHCIGEWVRPTFDLDDMEKWQLLTLVGHELLTLRRPTHSQSLHWLHYQSSHFIAVSFELLSLIDEDTLLCTTSRWHKAFRNIQHTATKFHLLTTRTNLSTFVQGHLLHIQRSASDNGTLEAQSLRLKVMQRDTVSKSECTVTVSKSAAPRTSRNGQQECCPQNVP
jgi:hypothetical protein